MFKTQSPRGIAVRKDQGFDAVQTVIFIVVCAQRNPYVSISHVDDASIGVSPTFSCRGQTAPEIEHMIAGAG